MQNLYYTYYQSPVGLLKIGGTDNYISELSFVDNKEQVTHGEPGISEIMHQCTEELIELFYGTTEISLLVFLVSLTCTFSSLFDVKQLKLRMELQFSITKIIQETSDTKSFYLEPANKNININYRAGQFLTLIINYNERE